MVANNILDAIASVILIGIFLSYSGSKLFQTEFKLTFRSVLLTLVIIFFSFLSHLFLENAIKMMVMYVVILFTYKSLYKKSLSQSAVSALISYLMLIIGELFVAVCLSIADKFIELNNMRFFTGNLFINICIISIALIILKLWNKQLNNLILKTKENNKFTLIFTFSLLLVAIWLLFYKVFINKFKFDETLFINGFLIIAMTYIGVIIIKQRYDKSKISEEYEIYVEYSKQSEKLVEEYSISQHENKNELIIIKSMVHKSNKRLLEYLDEIITSKDNIESAWIRHLRYIPFGGLKGILHNKISIMKELGINVFIDISKQIGKSSLRNLSIRENNQLSKVIGVFLDNAKEASLLSDQKEVSVAIFVDNDDVVFEISNSFCDKEMNLNKIYESGHSTKGKGRGYGLSLVKTIIDENSMFKNETKIVDEYFVQLLKVNLKK